MRGSMSLYPCAGDRKKWGGGRGGEEGMDARLICRQWSGPGIDDEVSEAFEVRRASRRGGTVPSECRSWSWCGSSQPFCLSVSISPICLNACQKLRLRLEKCRWENMLMTRFDVWAVSNSFANPFPRWFLHRNRKITWTLHPHENYIYDKMKVSINVFKLYTWNGIKEKRIFILKIIIKNVCNV